MDPTREMNESNGSQSCAACLPSLADYAQHHHQAQAPFMGGATCIDWKQYQLKVEGAEFFQEGKGLGQYKMWTGGGGQFVRNSQTMQQHEVRTLINMLRDDSMFLLTGFLYPVIDEYKSLNQKFQTEITNPF